MPLPLLLLLSRRHLLPHSVLPACMHLNLFLFDNHCMEALMYEYKFEETRLFKYMYENTVVLLAPAIKGYSYKGSESD